jgi:glyoxylase-like metal-dependent hydrolase (beta-lactamase superfamily II)
MRVGTLDVSPVADGTVYMDPTFFNYGKSLADWETAGHRDLLTPEGLLELTVGGFIVRGSGDRLVMIDTGFGADVRDDAPGGGGGLFEALVEYGVQVPPGGGYGGLVGSLREYGVEPADITDVILTHLHADHLTGTIENGQPTFPNATYRCHVKDWAFFATAQAPVSFMKGRPPADRLANMLGRLEPWDSEGEILPGIRALPTPGHTPGSTVIVLHSGPERAFMLGDVAHCVVELLEPEWDGLADFDTELARRSREALARELENDEFARVTGGHFPGLRFGRILLNSDKRRSFGYTS